jgi:Amt family ammonium transporter
LAPIHQAKAVSERRPNGLHAPVNSTRKDREMVLQPFVPRFRRALLAVAALLLPASALAQDAPPAIDTGDTAWMLASAALVLLMTPGLAFFYGGLVRSKNVLGTMMQSFVAIAAIGVLWPVIGYTLAFGGDVKGLIGGLDYLFLRGVGMEPNGTIPHLVFMTFQGMFAIITPALIAGSIAERMKFKAYLAFIILWVIFVYCPLCHWVWGGGWMAAKGSLDFAGGTVVHISSGVSGLVACLVLGRRKDFPREPIIPHNVPFVVLGGGLLWFGWFGFNAGSALAANGQAANAFVATHISAAAGALAWMMHDWFRFGKPTAVGTVSGAVAGLVGITPACGFVPPMAGIAIGVAAGTVCAMFVHWRTHRGIDDSLDAFGVHGIGGTVGAVLTGVFARTEFLIDAGRAAQVFGQIVDVVVTYLFAGIVALILLKAIDMTIGLRVEDDHEQVGLDQTQHGESGYSI